MRRRVFFFDEVFNFDALFFLTAGHEFFFASSHRSVSLFPFSNLNQTSNRLEEDPGNTARAPEATEKPQDTNANDASICNVDAADVAAAAKPQAPPPPQPVPSTSAALLGLPQRWDANQLRAWLRDELRCDFTTCRKKRGGSLAFVTFPSVEARRAADAATKRAKKIPGGGRLVLRDERGGGGGGGGKSQGHLQQQHSRKRAGEIDVRDIVTPLWRLSYEEQLAAKARRLRGVLQRIEAGIGIGGSSSAAKKNPSAAPIDFLGILRSPTTEGYRNKCEFTVGLGVGVAEEEGKTASDGKAECGFCLGAYRDGIVEVGPAAACPNVSRVAKACAAAFARFMREESALAPWDKRHNSGFWRLLIVREGRRETVLPRPPPPPKPRRREEGGEREGEQEGASSSSYSPPPPFASLDWRPWLVSSADLLEEEEKTKEGTKAAATTAAAEAGGEAAAAAVAAPAPAAAAAAAAAPPLPAAPSPAPSSSSPPAFEAPPADEILLVVQVDPTAPGASDDAVLKKELVALGKALRAAVASCRAGFAPPSSGGSSERWPPARLVLQHHSGLSNSAPDDAPLLPWPAGEEEEEAGGQGGKDEERKKAEAEGGGEGESGFITDSLCGLRFRVSPSSFFQVNSGAAALLYRLALDWAGLEKKREENENENENEKKEGAAAAAEENVGEKERGGGAAAGKPAENGDDGEAGEASGSSGAAAGGPVFLDVCCGTGTIGICAAAAGAARVVGVDVVAAAVRDAEANARANGLSVSSSSSSTPSPSPPSSSKAAPSCRFIAAKAEDVMASLLAEEEAAAGGGSEPKGRRRREFVAVVDPPRAGLHPKVRSALRGCPAVSRVVYVSCNPDTLASDCVHLCAKGGNGRAFRPVKAVAADLFPMTSHCEAVLLLER